MAKKDLKNNILIEGFTSATAIDLFGYNSHTFAVMQESEAAITVTITESDDNVTYKDAPATAVIGELSATAAKHLQFGYKGDCRYIKLTVTATSPTLVHVAGVPDVAGV